MDSEYCASANSLIKFMVISPILCAVTTGFAKTSLALFYRTISPQKWWRLCSYGLLFLLAGYNSAIFFAILFGCRPVKRNWDLTVPGTCIDKPSLYIATAALGIASDLVLLLMPIPMILRLQMPSRQKLGLIIFFAIGSL